MSLIRASSSYMISASLLSTAAILGFYLLPGRAYYDSEIMLRVEEIRTVDPNVFLFEDEKYVRVGRVFAEGGGFRLRLLGIDTECDCVVAMARPSFRQFIRMQTDEERGMFVDAAASAIAEIVQPLLTTGTADGPRNPIYLILVQAFTSAFEAPSVRTSRQEIVTYLTEQAGPEGMSELRQIMLERVRQAVETVFNDMTENYGMDILTRDFDLAPLSASINEFLSDRRVVNVLSQAFSNLIEDSDIGADVEAFTVAFIDGLLAAMSADENEILLNQAILTDDVLNNLMIAVEDFISRNGAAHPIVTAMIRNSLVQSVTKSEAVFVVLPRNVGLSWFDPAMIFELSGDRLG